jgi:hypothetical protein
MANPLDVEQSAPLRRRLATPNNDDFGGSRRLKFPEPPPGLPARHPLNILKRSSIIGGTLYVLHGECVATPEFSLSALVIVSTCFVHRSCFSYLNNCHFSNAIIPFVRKTEFKVFHNILHSPLVSHEWFKIGIATTIALLAVKAYVELYEGKLKDKKVEYENFKTATHWTIFLILVSWISFHMALSPVYGTFKTWLIMVGIGYGVLIQVALFIPVWGQNAISFILLTFFLQIYK